MATFGERLQSLRQAKNLTQVQIATLFGMTERAYRRYENNQSTPHYDTLVKLADYFDVSIDYLTGRRNFSFDADGNITVKVPIDIINLNIKALKKKRGTTA